ncbi:MAG: hypothetical protein M3Q97_05370, partial [Bacteroidota bacterium]|nr:hypothetical protein [Bacteroidota bacterium]
IQGKEALVGKGEGNYEVISVPTVTMEKSAIYDTTHLVIEGSDIKGSTVTAYTGFEKYYIVAYYSHLSKEKREEKLKEYFERGNNKGRINTYAYTGFEDRDKDLVTTYTFTVPDYVYHNGNELYVNMFLDKPLKGDVIDTLIKELDSENDYKYIYKTVTTLDIPEGYTAAKLPANSSFKDDMFGYDIGYKTEGGKVYLTQYVYINYLILPTGKFKDYNAMVRALNNAYRQNIVLKK